MTDIELGWLAGIIDGEGSICFSRRPFWRCPEISVPSTDIEILLEVQRILNSGSISKRTNRSGNKDTWQYKISGATQVLNILVQLEPHLKCPKKRKRAIYLIDGYKIHSNRGGNYSEKDKENKIQFENWFFKL